MHYRLWSQPFRSQVVLGLVERYRRYGIESPIRKAAQPVGRMAPIILDWYNIWWTAGHGVGQYRDAGLQVTHLDDR